MIEPTTDIHAFHFEIDTHVYRDADGNVHPSVTQILRAMKLIDYSHVDVEVLQRKAAIGLEVHDLTATFDRDGDIDPTWLTADTEGYVRAWQRFRAESGWEIVEVEHQKLATLDGARFGMTLDRICQSGKETHLVEIKCTAAAHPSWGIQLAAYEMGYLGRSRCGHMRRSAVQLKPNGDYRIHGFDDAADGDRFLEARNLTVWKQNHGLLTPA